MTSTTYSRTSGTAVLPGTWAEIQRRGDVPDADKLDPAERFDYDTADQSVRDRFKQLARQPLTEPPPYLRFALSTNRDPVATYEGEGAGGRYVADGHLVGMSEKVAATRLGIPESTLRQKLATFTGPVTLVMLPPDTEIYRTVGLTASEYSVDRGVVTNKLLGDFWEPSSPNDYQDIAEWREKTAVLAEWNGDYGHVAVRISKGITVLAGMVAEQQIHRDGHHVLPGGGFQYYIPNLTDDCLTEPVTGRPLQNVVRETRYRGRKQ